MRFLCWIGLHVYHEGYSVATNDKEKMLVKVCKTCGKKTRIAEFVERSEHDEY